MNRYVFNVDKRIFEIHIESSGAAGGFTASCFEVLEGSRERRLVPVLLENGDALHMEMNTEQEVLHGARTLLHGQFTTA
jgi:hypothetical protein